MREFQIAQAFQQAKTIHRLLLVLADDLGDLSAGRDADPLFAKLSDIVSGQLEPSMQQMRDCIGKASKL